MRIFTLPRHEKYGKRYVPVKWSHALKEEAEIWADKLAKQCELEHDKNTAHGENIALNYGCFIYKDTDTENLHVETSRQQKTPFL